MMLAEPGWPVNWPPQPTNRDRNDRSPGSGRILVEDQLPQGPDHDIGADPVANGRARLRVGSTGWCIHIIQIWIYLVWRRHARFPGWPAWKILAGRIHRVRVHPSGGFSRIRRRLLHEVGHARGHRPGLRHGPEGQGPTWPDQPSENASSTRCRRG
jgi:hypothetical protein